jgi:hypothetical protein
VDARSVDAFDVEADQSVVEQQHRAGRHVARQLLVVEADALVVAELAFGVEHEVLPGHELHASLLELADADLGTLQVGHDADLAPELLRAFAHDARALDVVGRDAVREVEANDVDACGKQARQDGGRAARRPEGGDDLRVAGHCEKPLRLVWPANVTANR